MDEHAFPPNGWCLLWLGSAVRYSFKGHQISKNQEVEINASITSACVRASMYYTCMCIVDRLEVKVGNIQEMAQQCSCVETA